MTKSPHRSHESLCFTAHAPNKAEVDDKHEGTGDDGSLVWIQVRNAEIKMTKMTMMTIVTMMILIVTMMTILTIMAMMSRYCQLSSIWNDNFVL